MTKSITDRHQWRVSALSLALGLTLGLIVGANVVSIAHAADSRACSPSTPQAATSTHVYPLYPLVPSDKYIDPNTGISLPDSPYNQ